MVLVLVGGVGLENRCPMDRDRGAEDWQSALRPLCSVLHVDGFGSDEWSSRVKGFPEMAAEAALMIRCCPNPVSRGLRSGSRSWTFFLVTSCKGYPTFGAFLY
jgi:hypothetical protein